MQSAPAPQAKSSVFCRAGVLMSDLQTHQAASEIKKGNIYDLKKRGEGDSPWSWGMSM